MLIHLLKDVWFYISAGGFLASLILFVFLLGQYRLAVEAEEENTEDNEEALESVEPQEKSQEPIQSQTEREQFEIAPETLAEESAPTLISPEPLEAPLPSPSQESVPSIPIAKEEMKEAPRLNEEIKILSEGMNKLAEQMNSLEKVFIAESRSNLKALEKISALLKEQTEKMSTLSAPSLVKEEETSSSKKIKLKTPKIEETLVLKPENESKDQKTEVTEPQQLELSIKETPEMKLAKAEETSPKTNIEPAKEPAEKNKSPLKIKDPKDLDAIDENTLSTRKGPVWPI